MLSTDFKDYCFAILIRKKSNAESRTHPAFARAIIIQQQIALFIDFSCCANLENPAAKAHFRFNKILSILERLK